MPKCPITAYIGLLGPSGKEPCPESGYSRVKLGDADLWDAPKLLDGNQLVFDEATAPGYGLISMISLYNAPEGDQPLYIWVLDEPVDVHAGVIPAVVNGRLIRGVDVSAQVIASLKDSCAVGS